MNGRCETDPLDRAVDVCDRCYGEFCDAHLLRPKGRKHPLCSDCALTASGVRGDTRVEPRGERKTAKKRRKALQDGASNDEQVFEFFDHRPTDQNVAINPELGTAVSDGPSSVRQSTGAAEPSGGSRDTEVGGNGLGDNEVGKNEAGDHEAVDESPPTPAVAKLERLRREAEDKPATRGDANANSPLVGDAAVRPASGPIEAVDRRRPLEPPSHRAPAPERAPDSAGRLAPLPNRQSTRPVPAPPPERIPPAERTEGDQAAPPKPYGATDRRRQTPPPTHRRATAPMIGEVRNVAGRRADDAATEADPTKADPSGLDQAETDATLNAVEKFDAGRASALVPAPTPTSGDTAENTAENTADNPTNDTVDHPGGGEPESNRVDVDANGDWIPPVLRGIAPDAAEAKADLPHRPRR